MKRAKPGMGRIVTEIRRPCGFGGRLTCIKVRPRTRPDDPPMPSPPITAALQDDVQGLVTGTLFVALGVFLMKCAGLVPGGLVGVALLLHYATHWDLGAVLFVVNLPFYVLAWTRMGHAFTLRTALVVSMLSAVSWWLPRAITLQQIDGPVAAVLGGLLAGAGMLIVFRHRASLGGLNTLVLRLQDRFGWPAGKTQMAIDAAIVLAGGWYGGDLRKLGLSVLAVVALNLALVYNHRPGRYQPV
jgi:uncharacterized membrane-anchored protein YitT (DUF2179 family)